MPVNLAAVKDRVQRLLVKMLGSVEVDQDGDFTFPYESTRIYIRVGALGDLSIVSVFAITNYDVPASAELFQFVATRADQWIFGHLGAVEKDDGTVTVNFRHTLLGDFLDAPELKTALSAVATSADEIDDEIKQRFGGHTIYEE